MRHCTSSSRGVGSASASAASRSTEGDERDLRGVGRRAEHRLPREEAADLHAVQAADEVALGGPGLDGVRPAEPVQLGVGLDDAGRDPAVRAARVAAGLDDLDERGVDRGRVAAAGLAQRRRHAQPVEREDAARVGRPPADRALGLDRHREQPRAVRRQQGARLEVGADAEQLGARHREGRVGQLPRRRAAARPGARATVRSGARAADVRGHLGRRRLAVGLGEAVEEVLLREVVLLRADRLDDVGREQRADLGAALVATAPTRGRRGSRRGTRRRRRSGRP